MTLRFAIHTHRRLLSIYFRSVCRQRPNGPVSHKAYRPSCKLDRQFSTFRAFYRSIGIELGLKTAAVSGIHSSDVFRLISVEDLVLKHGCFYHHGDDSKWILTPTIWSSIGLRQASKWLSVVLPSLQTTGIYRLLYLDQACVTATASFVLHHHEFRELYDHVWQILRSCHNRRFAPIDADHQQTYRTSRRAPVVVD